MSIYGLITAAGIGERMKPLTNKIPKPLIKVGGKPLIQNAVEYLVHMGIKDIVVALYYKKGMIKAFLDSVRLDANIHYAYPDKLLGLAYSVLSAKDIIDDTFVLYLPDNIFTEKCNYAIERHVKGKSTATLVIEEGEPQGRFATLKMKGDRIEDIIEKANVSYGMRDTGIYIFSPEIFDYCSKVKPSIRGELELQDAIKLAIADGKTVLGVKIKGKRFEVTTPDDLNRIEAELKDI